jgi:DNA-binding ferritin-like protein (Dps family)
MEDRIEALERNYKELVLAIHKNVDYMAYFHGEQTSLKAIIENVLESERSNDDGTTSR